MNLSADYDKEKTGYKYNDTFCSNLLKFWQYTDLYGSWHGLQVDGSPADNPVFGVINLPNPAYTDAAHRNGVLSLGCWFWPREEQNFSDWVERKPDGSFPVADKMIEMAVYFGFDGYFINQEASISSADAENQMEMIKYIREKAPANFHLQWYDCLLISGKLSYQNGFNDKNAPWIIDKGVPVNNSMFVNYAWSENSLISGNRYAKSLGLDPFKVLFAGTENDKYGYNPPYDPKWIFPEDGVPRASWALFGTEFVWNRYVNKFDPDDQEEVFKRERRYWSGQNENPANTIRTLYSAYPDPYHAVNPEEYRCWDGVAHYIPERSVIGSYPFVTRFNTGHGRSFFLNGDIASTKEWNNASIQDILPSWQWWVKSCDGEPPLTPKFDYSTAYDGGSSLKVSGMLGPSNTTELRLFKTKLDVTDAVNLSITYKTGMANTPTKMSVELIFEDDPNSFVWLQVGNSSTDRWDTKTFNLGDYTGRTIASIGLQFESTAKSGYSIHIGEMALTNKPASAPAAQTGFTINKAYFASDKAELFLSWDFNLSEVWYYDIYRVNSDGGREAIGRIYDEVYYVKSLDRSGREVTSTLELVAVGLDGAKSKPIQTILAWPKTG